ncbi:MAG: hypothetical protein KF716_27345 [Anaerolineae bacterium]|nr:hypothetical protein [Anaerolineae bacterium]
MLAHVTNLIDEGKIEEAIASIPGNVTYAEKITLTRALSRELALALSKARELARTLARASAITRTSELALTLVRTLDRALDRALAHTLANALDRARASARVFARAHNFTQALASDLALAHALTNDLTLALDHALDRGLQAIKDNLATAMAYRQVIAAILGSNISVTSPKAVLPKGATLILTGMKVLTPEILATVLVPFTQALADLQQLAAQLLDKPFSSPQLRFISQSSHMEVRGENISDAVKSLVTWINPLRDQQMQRLTALEMARITLDIKKKEEELSVLRLKSYQPREDTTLEHEQAIDALRRLRSETNKMRLEFERQKVQIENERVATAVAWIKQLKPAIPENEMIADATKALKPINLLIESPITARLKPIKQK